MNHPNGDTLLKYVLGTLDESETEAIRQHLSSCEECRNEERKIDGEVTRLSIVDIPLGTVEPPRLPRKTRRLVPVLKAAAVLAVGFFIGYATAELSNPVSPIPVQQRLIPSQVAVPSSGYVPVREVDIRTPPNLR
jgi:anti-sigma factor RsiW